MLGGRLRAGARSRPRFGHINPERYYRDLASSPAECTARVGMVVSVILQTAWPWELADDPHGVRKLSVRRV